MSNDDGSIIIEGARIVFRNFAGKEGMYNREGDRNFAILLDPEFAEKLAKDGWNIKTLKPREDDEEPTETPYLQVSVSFKGRPPRVVLVNSQGQTNLDESSVEILDWADIANVDLRIRPYEWVINGKSGIKAYLKSIFVTIDEDELDRKYAAMEGSPSHPTHEE